MAAKFNIYCDEPTTSNPKHQQLVAPAVTCNNLSSTTSSILTTGAQTGVSTTTTTTSALHQLANSITIINNKTAGLATSALAQQSSQNAISNKREPLGLRQHLTQPQPPPTSQQQQQSQTLSQHTTSSVPTSKEDEDQENDISMASLGSDFVPSIVNDAEFDSYEYDDYDEILQSSDESRLTNHDQKEDNELVSRRQSHQDRVQQPAEQKFLSENDSSFMVDDDEEFDDEEIQKELKQAFKKHDDSQLFKSAVYIDDIEKYLLDLECSPEVRALPNYMTFQPDIDSKKRAILVNWLVDVADEFDLESETLFICVNLIDRFLSQMSLPTINLQLLGVAAMFIASKYEEIYPPYLHQFVEVTDDTYSGRQIRRMEQEILKALNFRISMPTIIYFLKRIFAYNKFSEKCYHLAEYLCHLSLLSEEPFLEYYPSEIALASVILAAHQLDGQGEKITSELRATYDKSNQAQLDRRCLVPSASAAATASCSNQSSNQDLLARQSDIDRRIFIADKDLPFCIESLREMQERAFVRSSKHQQTDNAIITKFSSDCHQRVALLPPPSVEDLWKLA